MRILDLVAVLLENLNVEDTTNVPRDSRLQLTSGLSETASPLSVTPPATLLSSAFRELS